MRPSLAEGAHVWGGAWGQAGRCCLVWGQISTSHADWLWVEHTVARVVGVARPKLIADHTRLLQRLSVNVGGERALAPCHG